MSLESVADLVTEEAFGELEDQAHGRWRKWMSLCLMGNALSQQLNALDTSLGVQMGMWLQLTSFLSKM